MQGQFITSTMWYIPTLIVKNGNTNGVWILSDG